MSDNKLELDISKFEDRSLLLKSVEDIYRDVTEVESEIDDDILLSIKKTICELQEQIQQINNTSSNDIDVSDDRVDNLQSNYNELIKLRDQLYDFLSNESVDNKEEEIKENNNTNPDSEENCDVNLQSRKSKKLLIQIPEQNEGDIAITVAKLIESKIASEQNNKVITFTPTSILQRDSSITSGNKKMYSNRVAVNQHKTPFVQVDSELGETSLTNKYLISNIRYQSFINKNYSSTDAFEKIIDSTITNIEKKATDIFERWLQEDYASTFVFLEDMTVHEINELSKDTDLRKLLEENNIKYEALLIWIDKIPEMLSLIKGSDSITFGRLFATWMIETEMVRFQQ